MGDRPLSEFSLKRALKWGRQAKHKQNKRFEGAYQQPYTRNRSVLFGARLIGVSIRCGPLYPYLGAYILQIRESHKAHQSYVYFSVSFFRVGCRAWRPTCVEHIGAAAESAAKAALGTNAHCRAFRFVRLDLRHLGVSNHGCPILGSFYEGSYYFGSVLITPDFWKFPSPARPQLLESILEVGFCMLSLPSGPVCGRYSSKAVCPLQSCHASGSTELLEGLFGVAEVEEVSD